MINPDKPCSGCRHAGEELDYDGDVTFPGRPLQCFKYELTNPAGLPYECTVMRNPHRTIQWLYPDYAVSVSVYDPKGGPSGPCGPEGRHWEPPRPDDTRDVREIKDCRYRPLLGLPATKTWTHHLERKKMESWWDRIFGR